jgi:hypothetical protein
MVRVVFVLFEITAQFNNRCTRLNNNSGKWQGRLDSNQRMPGSKPGALPLGDAPIFLHLLCFHTERVNL